jgi:hypothetical protein
MADSAIASSELGEQSDRGFLTRWRGNPIGGDAAMMVRKRPLPMSMQEERPRSFLDDAFGPMQQEDLDRKLERLRQKGTKDVLAEIARVLHINKRRLRRDFKVVTSASFEPEYFPIGHEMLIDDYVALVSKATDKALFFTRGKIFFPDSSRPVNLASIPFKFLEGDLLFVESNYQLNLSTRRKKRRERVYSYPALTRSGIRERFSGWINEEIASLRLDLYSAIYSYPKLKWPWVLERLISWIRGEPWFKSLRGDRVNEESLQRIIDEFVIRNSPPLGRLAT